MKYLCENICIWNYLCGNLDVEISVWKYLTDLRISVIFFHQRSLDWNDIPDRCRRRAGQRYVHFIAESAQYLDMDIHWMDGFFNWTMTHGRNSDFPLLYGHLVQVAPHPSGDQLEEYIK